LPGHIAFHWAINGIEESNISFFPMKLPPVPKHLAAFYLIDYFIAFAFDIGIQVSVAAFPYEFFVSAIIPIEEANDGVFSLVIYKHGVCFKLFLVDV
jgi:hypothetical protein